MTCLERELTLDHIHTFLFSQGLGGPPRKRVQLKAGATSETTQTWKTIDTIHSNKAKKKVWLWQSNDIRGTCGPKGSWHLSYRWGKTPKITSSRKLVPTGDLTQARCVTGVHATAYSPVIDTISIHNLKYLLKYKWYCKIYNESFGLCRTIWSI